MKKMMVVFALVCLIFSMLSVCAAPVNMDSPKTNLLPATGKTDAKRADDKNYPGFCGRLYIPTVDINVALYRDSSQLTCDRPDSACFFPVDSYDGIVIADHNTQEFAALPLVTKGTMATILQADGEITTLRCTDVFDGHNTGENITDGEWHNVLGSCDYLTYTCLNDWTNVRVCEWEVVTPETVNV